jgi:sugar phosphate isomerase/epimerase
MEPQLAFCTHLTRSYETAVKLAAKNGMTAVEHSFTLKTMPFLKEETQRIKELLGQQSEIRYHAVFNQDDIGAADIKRSRASLMRFMEAVRLVGEAGGWFLTIHVDLKSEGDPDWIYDNASSNLKELVEFGNENGVLICVENLRSGLTSKPDQLKKLIEYAEAGVTLDLGHAAGPRGIEKNPEDVLDFQMELASFIVNAHIYGTEDKNGHEPPKKLEALEPVLNGLMMTDCDWWTIELGHPDDLDRIHRYIRDYFDRLKVIENR